MTSEATSATSEYTIVIALRGPSDDREFLMVRHAERGWELPGGKFEGDEGPVHCGLREFREETGHILSHPKYVMKMQKPNGLAWVFQGEMGPAVGDIDPDEKIVEMDWFSKLPENLGFPDDPYEEMGQLIGIKFR
jgi:8-oxo-dGTP pyrophosphatase MutT (NUDIX family)